MFRKCAHFMAAITLVATLTAAVAQGAVLKDPTTGTPAIKSINVISFAPEGVLLIGDGRGSQVFAVSTGDTTKSKGLGKPIDGIRGVLAETIGAPVKDFEIVDLAVNPISGKAYFAVQRKDQKRNLILTVDGAGEIDEFALENVTYARVPLVTGSKAIISAITDVAWAEDRIIAAGRSNESFASKIFSVYAPLRHDSESAGYSAETYHVSHRRWETKAPMSVVMPLKEGDKTYVVGAFSCTPVVKYPLDSLKPDAVVKGSSMIELGSGNRPLGMFSYEKDGKLFVLSNTFRFHHERKPFGPSPYWTVRFEQSLLEGDDKVNEEAQRRLGGEYKPATDRIQMIEAYHGVAQMARLDETRALVLRTTEGDDFNLEPLPLP
jgi:hypothetical protein